MQPSILFHLLFIGRGKIFKERIPGQGAIPTSEFFFSIFLRVDIFWVCYPEM